jgi:hypothetical protein
MVVFHGTDEVSAVSIVREGFREGTYFSPYRSVAEDYGCVVFEVDLGPGVLKGENHYEDTDELWQFHIRHAYGPEVIRHIYR